MDAVYAFSLISNMNSASPALHLTAISLFWETSPKYPVISIMTNDFDNHTLLLSSLEAKKIQRVVVKPVTSGCRANGFKYGKVVLTKLRVWSLIQYRRILLFDNDVMVIDNIDHVMSKWIASNATELRTPTGCNKNVKQFNTGVWGVSPYLSYATRAVTTSHMKKKCDLGDQTLASQLGANHTAYRLSVEYNMKADQGVQMCMRRRNISRLYVIHWSGGAKPISRSTTDPVEKVYLSRFQRRHQDIRLSLWNSTNVHGRSAQSW
jgi:lipopolysaccharide biosynthesis glycosyltransferase